MNDDYAILNLDNPGSNVPMLHNLINQNFHPQNENCIKLILCQGLIFDGNGVEGYAQDRIDHNFNGAVYQRTPRSISFVHELGHYFGLPHTFANPATQYVHDFEHPVMINGVSHTCLQTGDGFCDTPADLETCSEDNESCEVYCIPPAVDPLGTPYHPNPYLFMSYYRACWSKFSPEQRAFMIAVYLTHPNYEAIRQIDSFCSLKKARAVRDCLDPSTELPVPMAELTVVLKQVISTCSDITTSLGHYQINPCNWGNEKRSVMPDMDYRNNDLNGVNVADIFLINQHILGFLPLDGPFKLIAADANYSGGVTTSDAVAIRKTVLTGGAIALPFSSWRYIPNLALGNTAFWNQFNDGHPFDAIFFDPFQGFIRTYANPSNTIPNNVSWMDHVNVFPNDLLAEVENTWTMTGIKVGDVNCEAESTGPNEEPGPDFSFDNSGSSPIGLNIDETKKVAVKASAAEQILAWQMGMITPSNQLQILSILPGNVGGNFDPENFDLANLTSPNGGQKLSALWFSSDGNAVEMDNSALFVLEVKGNANITNIKDLITLSPSILEVKFFDESLAEVEVELTIVEVAHPRELTELSKPIEKKMVTLYPNPFSNQVWISIHSKEETKASVRFCDMYGNSISKKVYDLNQGLNELSAPELQEVNPGIIFFEIEASGIRTSGKLLKQ